MCDDMSDRDVLRSLGVGGEATGLQWAQIVEEAQADHAYALRFVRESRDQAGLAAMVARAADVARSVELPECEAVEAAAAAGEPTHTGSAGGARLFVGWAGWLVAACLLVAWVQFGPRHPEHQTRTQSASMSTVPGTTADEALRAYIERGRAEDRHIEEVPHRLLIDARPLDGGAGTEVLYLRQFVERTVVPDLYRLGGQNELGQPSLVRYVPHAGGSL